MEQSTETLTLVEFLRQRLAEDEQAARAVKHADWWFDVDGWAELTSEVATHAQRHDPARVLREVSTKRWILDEYEKEAWVLEQGHRTGWTEGGQAARETAIRILAAVYCDHPDYRREWEPARG